MATTEPSQSRKPAPSPTPVDPATLSYASESYRWQRWQPFLNWLANQRRKIVVVAIVGSLFQLTRMIPAERRTDVHTCQRCAALRTDSSASYAGVVYRHKSDAGGPHPLYVRYVDEPHDHTWLPLSTTARRGNVWGFGDETVTGNGASRQMTLDALDAMYGLAHLTPGERRQIYARLLAARSLGEMSVLLVELRVEYDVRRRRRESR
jgi:hypothetical protein